MAVSAVKEKPERNVRIIVPVLIVGVSDWKPFEAISPRSGKMQAAVAAKILSG